MNKEIWKPVVGFEGYYEVSNKGNVRSLDRYVNTRGGQRLARGRLKKVRNDIGGYLTVSLSKERKNRAYFVHRLVAEAFIPNPDNLPIVNHKDEIRTNNCVENLEWCDKSYNQLYSLNLHPERAYVFGNNFRDKETGENLSPWTKKNVPHRNFKPVEQRTLNGEFIARYDSIIAIQNQTGYDSGFIKKCCDGIYKRAYGYIWAWAS